MSDSYLCTAMEVVGMPHRGVRSGGAQSQGLRTRGMSGMDLWT